MKNGSNQSLPHIKMWGGGGGGVIRCVLLLLLSSSLQFICCVLLFRAAGWLCSTSCLAASVVEWSVFLGRGISFLQRLSKLLLRRRIWALLQRVFEVPHYICPANTPRDHSESSQSSTELNHQNIGGYCFHLSCASCDASANCFNPLSLAFDAPRGTISD